jgi:membrane protease YdiL (CAAX protease family)
MNYLEAALNGKNAWWRYVVMIFAILVATNTIGSIPLLIPFLGKLASDPSVAGKLSANPTDFSVLGVDPFYGLFMMLFPFIAGLVAFALLVRPLHQRKFISTINVTGGFRWNHFFISFLIWMTLSVIYLFAYMKVEPENFIISNTSISLLYISLIAVAMIPFQAGLEELIFRGYLMQGFATVVKNRWFPLIMTSLLFALMHSMNPEVKEYGFLTMMPQYIAFGLIFGIVAIMDNGIEAAIGAHAANNIFLVIMVTQESSALPTPALYEQKVIYPWTEFTGLVICGIVFIFLMKMIFGWDKRSGFPAEEIDYK